MNALATYLPPSPFPPTPIYLRKGKFVKDPSAVRKFNPFLQDSQGHADDLSSLNSEVSGQLVQQLPILFGEADRSLTAHLLQGSPSKNGMALSNTSGGPAEPEVSLTGTSSGYPQLYAVVGPNSIAGTCQPSPALDWLLNPEKSDAIFDRILARLVQSEAHEPNVHLRDDYRIAWLTVRFCQTGECDFKQADGSIKKYSPHVWATVRVLGCHPDQVWFRIQQRRQAMLGRPISIAAASQTVAPGAAALPPQRKESAPVQTPERKQA